VCRAQTNRDNLLFLDFSYTQTGFMNQGWGIGLNYEKKLVDFLSVKGNLGHMTFLTGIEEVYSTSVDLSLYFNYYPLSNGLDKLYLGIGGGCDFMNYFGKGELPPTKKDTLIHVTPLLGWKFNIFSFLLVDLFVGYKFLVVDAQNYREIKNYLNPGFRYGIDFLIFLNKKKENNDDQNN
jgi:hypothetical protein